MMAAGPALLAGVGAVRLLPLAAVAAVVRWLALAHIQHPAGLFAAQALHGITFGVWYLALVETVQADAGDDVRASAQSILMSTVSVGMVSGYLLGGRLMEDLGGVTMYHVAAAISVTAGMLYLSRLVVRRRATRTA